MHWGCEMTDQGSVNPAYHAMRQVLLVARDDIDRRVNDPVSMHAAERSITMLIAGVALLYGAIGYDRTDELIDSVVRGLQEDCGGRITCEMLAYAIYVLVVSMWFDPLLEESRRESPAIYNHMAYILYPLALMMGTGFVPLRIGTNGDKNGCKEG